MKNCELREDLLLKRIEDTRIKMIRTGTLYPLHSCEVIKISKKLDNLLNQLESLNKGGDIQKYL